MYICNVLIEFSELKSYSIHYRNMSKHRLPWKQFIDKFLITSESLPVGGRAHPYTLAPGSATKGGWGTLSINHDLTYLIVV